MGAPDDIAKTYKPTERVVTIRRRRTMSNTSTPEGENVRRRTTPQAPRKRRRTRRDDGYETSSDDDSDASTRAIDRESPDRVEALRRLAALPSNAIFAFLTGGGAFLAPDRVVELLEQLDLSDEASKIADVVQQVGFYPQLVRECFPRVRHMPTHIDLWVRGGARPRPQLANGRFLSRDEAGWLRTLEYILTVLAETSVSVADRGATRGSVRVRPSLSITEREDDALATCADFVRRPHTAAHTYIIDDDDDDVESGFAFTVNVGDRPGSDGMSDDELTDIGVEDTPVLSDYNAIDESRDSIGDILRDGVVVHTESVDVYDPYADVLDASFSVRWRSADIGLLAARFDTRAVSLETHIDARLDVRPRRVDDRFLWAVAMRQASVVDDVYRRPLRIALTVTESVNNVSGSVLESTNVRRDVRLEVDPRTRFMTVQQAYGNNNDIGASLYATARQLYLQALPTRTPPYANNSDWVVDREWDDAGNVTGRFYSPPYIVDDNFRSQRMLGEVVGPPQLRNGVDVIRVECVFHVDQQ